ncbi:UNVERIFIED_ORG: cell division GTPase FtsZ [Ensifer adhaerens]|nr:cell division GTPase FtsZ [Ensifer adhaerens]
MVTPQNTIELTPRITVIGVGGGGGGGGGNAVNNMIAQKLEGAEFIVANTDAQALSMSNAPRLIQLGLTVTGGLARKLIKLLGVYRLS